MYEILFQVEPNIFMQNGNVPNTMWMIEIAVLNDLKYHLMQQKIDEKFL
jgi:hypothetical protein